MDPEQIPLRDLHLPAEIGSWPPAPGWWILLGIGLAMLGWSAWLAFLRWRANRARRIALGELVWISRRYEQTGDRVELARSLSGLLRRALLAYAPRQTVAGLTGDAWLEWLDRGLDEPVFERGVGRQIGTLPYRDPSRADDDGDAAALIDAVRLRLKTPLSEGAA